MVCFDYPIELLANIPLQHRMNYSPYMHLWDVDIWFSTFYRAFCSCAINQKISLQTVLLVFLVCFVCVCVLFSLFFSNNFIRQKQYSVMICILVVLLMREEKIVQKLPVYVNKKRLFECLCGDFEKIAKYFNGNSIKWIKACINQIGNSSNFDAVLNEKKKKKQTKKCRR